MGFLTILSLILQYIINFICDIFLSLFSLIPAIICIVAFVSFPKIQPEILLSTVIFNYSPSIIAIILFAAIVPSTICNSSSDMLYVLTIFTKAIVQRYLN